MKTSSGDAFSIREMRPEEAAECEAVMRSLPDWFGIEESILQYRRDLEAMETIIAETDGRLIAFLTLKRHNRYASEIQILAVRAEFHRRGVGRALVGRAIEILRERDTEYLQVKTLGPSRESEFYAQTRGFYESIGFRPLEETNLWGERNPCLIMVMHLASSTGD